MTFPVEISFLNHTLNLHFVCEVLAFFIGFRYFMYLRRKTVDLISDTHRLIILIGATSGAFIFSRLLGAMENPLEWFHHQKFWLYLYSNKTIVGGLLGGLLTTEITKSILGVKQSSGDLYTYPLILAIIIGRIGCFSMGIHEETYGIETTIFTGMNLGDGLLRHPVTLYEISVLLILWICLKQAEKNQKFNDGIRFQLFLITYCLFRFLLDFIKPGFTYGLGIGSIQISCLLTLFYYRKTIITLFSNPKSLYI